MKQWITLLLTLCLCVSLAACGSESTPPATGGTDTTKPTDAEANINNSGDLNGTTVVDVVSGLPYTLTCRDGMSADKIDNIPYAASTAPDDGRLNDGIFRTKEEIKADKENGEAVVFDGKTTYEYTMTFETDGRHDAYEVVFHNIRQNDNYMAEIMYIEVGEDKDNLVEVDHKDAYIGIEGEYVEEHATFDAVNFKVISITFFSKFKQQLSFEEVSVLGVATGSKPPVTQTTPTTEATKPNSNTSLVGVWESIDPEYPDNIVRITFNADNSGQYLQTGGNATVNMPITWSITDTTMTLTAFGKTLRSTPYHFEGEKLYMEDEDGRGTLFTRVE